MYECKSYVFLSVLMLFLNISIFIFVIVSICYANELMSSLGSLQTNFQVSVKYLTSKNY